MLAAFQRRALALVDINFTAFVADADAAFFDVYAIFVHDLTGPELGPADAERAIGGFNFDVRI